MKKWLSKKWVFYTLITFFALIFLVSSFFLIRYLRESKKSADLYGELAQQVRQDQTTAPASLPEPPPASHGTEPTQPPAPTEPPLVQAVNSDTGETVSVLPEYKEIFQRNSHTVGWIRIPDTQVDYPVVQNKAKINYYLHRDFDREPNRHGCIYAGEAFDLNKPSDQVVLYGHWMRDRSMFGSLQFYKDPAYYEAHPLIRFDTLTEHHTYEIFCVFRTTATVGEGFRYNQLVDAADQEEFDEFIRTCHGLEMYSTGKTARYGDKLLTLSTCEYSQPNGRLVVVAKRIS